MSNDIFQKGALLQVGPDRRVVVARTRYVTQSEPTGGYTKVFCDDHYVLVLLTGGELVSYGRDVGAIPHARPGRRFVRFQGARYELAIHDYQIVAQLEFGDPLTTEGEVEFWDYVEVSGAGKGLSLGVCSRTGRRADVVQSPATGLPVALVDGREA